MTKEEVLYIQLDNGQLVSCHPDSRLHTVKLALKAHPPGGHTRAVGAIFQGTRQGTPPVCPDWNSNMILTGQALKAHFVYNISRSGHIELPPRRAQHRDG